MKLLVIYNSDNFSVARFRLELDSLPQTLMFKVLSSEKSPRKSRKKLI